MPTSDLYSFVCIRLMSYVIKTGCFAEVRKLKKMNSQCDQFMSETTNDVVFDPKKSEKFGKCRKSFFMSFLTFVCHFTILQKSLFFQ